MQRRIIELELFQRVAQAVILVGLGRVQTGKHLGLDLFETRQSFGGWPKVVGQLLFKCDGVAHLGCLQLFDARNDVAHLARFERFTRLVGRGEHTKTARFVNRIAGHHANALVFEQLAIDHTHQHDHTHIGVEPTVDDHGAQRRIRVALGRRNAGHHSLEDFFDAHAGFGRAGNRIGRVDADHVFHFAACVLRIGVGQVHLVEDGDHFHAQVECGVAIGHGLRFHALAGIDHQQSAFAGRQRAAYFIREVHMARCVDQVEVVNLSVLGFVLQRSGLGLDGDAALFLDVHRVQHLGFHVPRFQTSATLNQAIGQRGFAMVNVRNDRKISDVIHQGSSASVGGSRIQKRKKGASVSDAP